MIKSIKSISKIIGVKGLKNLCIDIACFGEKYEHENTLYNIEYTLNAYRDTDNIINYFNSNRQYCEENYTNTKEKYVPFYKTKDFENQCNKLRSQGFFATDFI